MLEHLRRSQKRLAKPSDATETKEFFSAEGDVAVPQVAFTPQT